MFIEFKILVTIWEIYQKRAISFITNDIQNTEIISDTAEMEKIEAKPDDIISFDAWKRSRGAIL